MKLINRLLLLLLLASMPHGRALAQSNGNASPAYFLHTVQKGQSLYSISSIYQVSQDDIIRLNPGCDAKIYAGQTLKIPQAQGQSLPQYHTIQAQETLYQLTVRYGVSAQRICQANPGLSAQNFKIGQVILIPVAEKEAPAPAQAAQPEGKTTAQPADGSNPSPCRDMHKVKRKETIYSISRQYGISKEELIAANPELKKGLKRGSFLCIPYPKEEESIQLVEQPRQQPQGQERGNRELFAASREKGQQLPTIKAAIILPFLPEGNDAATSSKMVEYYEGFLIAADSLKRQGVSIDLHVYDSGNNGSSLSPVLNREELKTMHIIFGPMHASHIQPLANFAHKHGIHLVIPFSSKDDEVFHNPEVFQINTPQSYLYSEVYEHFLRKFPNANVVFLENKNDTKGKAQFINGLKEELDARSIPYATANASSTSAALKPLLKPGRDNIFIPTSGSNAILINLLPQLTVLKRENAGESISLFGYPEWQTYTKDHLERFYELDTYFYSSFYTNNLFPAAVQFTNSYRNWYGKDMINSYPKFGMLGFDTGYFFLKALAQYGTGFESHLRDVQVRPIQTGFKFERVSNWGGFINRKVFFVHFTKDYELIKLDFE